MVWNHRLRQDSYTIKKIRSNLWLFWKSKRQLSNRFLTIDRYTSNGDWISWHFHFQHPLFFFIQRSPSLWLQSSDRKDTAYLARYLLQHRYTILQKSRLNEVIPCNYNIHIHTYTSSSSNSPLLKFKIISGRISKKYPTQDRLMEWKRNSGILLDHN